MAAALRTAARRPMDRPGALLSGVGAVLIVAVSTGMVVAGRRTGEATLAHGDQAKPVLAVLPFSGPSDRPWAKYLADGMTEFVTNDLSGSRDLIVVSNGSVHAAAGETLTLADVAKELGASYLVQGELEPSNGALHVRFRLFSARDARTIDAGLVETQAQDIAHSNRTLANAVRRKLQQAGLPAGPPPDRGQQWPSTPAVAEDYSSGRDLLQHWNEGGNLDRAIDAFTRVTAAEPGFPSAHAYLGESFWRKYRRTGDPLWADRARSATFEALRLGSNDSRVRYSAALVLAGTGRREQAIEEAKRAIELQPTGDDAYRLMGRILSDSGSFDEARPYLDAAIALRPGYAGNHHALGLAAYNHGRLDTAIRAFRRAAELRPTSADAWQALGTAYHANDDLEQAMQSYEHANAIEPTDFAYSNIGLLHYWNGRYEAAVQAYRRSSELSTNEPETHRNLGDALRMTAERSRAAASYRRAIELADVSLATNPRQPRLLTLKALCHARLGNVRLALALAAQGVAEALHDAETVYRAGVAAELAGDRARARTWLKRALELGYSRSLMDRDTDLDDLRRSGWR
jgi:tetratricopeptide (TPR) repeat protein